jgi:Ras family protein A
LVGCKKDLRHDPKTIEELFKTSQRPVTTKEVRRPDHLNRRSKKLTATLQAEEVAKVIGARAYFETSAKTSEGVREVFYHSIQMTMEELERSEESRPKRRKGPFRWLFQ